MEQLHAAQRGCSRRDRATETGAGARYADLRERQHYPNPRQPWVDRRISGLSPSPDCRGWKAALSKHPTPGEAEAGQHENASIWGRGFVLPTEKAIAFNRSNGLVRQSESSFSEGTSRSRFAEKIPTRKAEPASHRIRKIFPDSSPSSSNWT